MEFLDKMLPGLLSPLPAWLVWCLFFVLILLKAWPTIREMFRDALPTYRSYTREKMRLELLKLIYEIEALKKSNQLGDHDHTLPKPFIAARPIDLRDDVTANEVEARERRLSIAIWGFGGGMAPAAVKGLVALFLSHPSRTQMIVF